MKFLEDVFQEMPAVPVSAPLTVGAESGDTIEIDPTNMVNHQFTTADKTALESAAPCEFSLLLRVLLCLCWSNPNQNIFGSLQPRVDVLLKPSRHGVSPTSRSNTLQVHYGTSFQLSPF